MHTGEIEGVPRGLAWQSAVRRLTAWGGELALDARALRIVQLLLLALMGFVLIRTAWMCDDAYITLRTVDNFIHGHGLRWNIAERVQTYTHPLWLFILTVPYLFTHEAFYTVLTVSMAISFLTVALFVLRSRGAPGAIAVGVLVLLCSRSFTDYSTSGLENPLTHFLILLFLLLLDRDRPGSRRLLLLSGITGLATLNRIDTLLLLLPGLVYALVRFRERRGLWLVAAGFLPFLVWELFATFYYGFPYPNTAPAKLRAGIEAAELIRHGFYYLENSLRYDPVTLMVLAVALVATLCRRRPRNLAVAGGIVLYLLYVIKIGGDFMSGRFLSAPLFVAVVLLAQSNPLPRRFGQVALAVAALLLGTMTPYPPLLSGPRFGAAEDHLFDRHGICDERRYYFGSSGMINDIPKAKKPSHDAMKVGQTARRAATPLIVEGAIGFTGYGAGPAVHIVDYHALADPLLSRMPMVVRDTRYDRALFRMLGETDPQGWRIGHLLRNVPPGYLRTLVTGTNHLEDPRLRRFYDQLRVVTQAPLWSAHRIAEIVRMNLGHYDKLIDRTRPPQDEAVDWGEVIAVLPNVAEPYYQRGKQFFDARQSDRAIADLRRALELDPLHTDALILLGSIYMDKEETDQAIHCLNQVMAIDPREVTSYVYLGDLALRAKQHERAIALFKQAHHLDPRLWLACNNLGVAYVELGNNEEALAWLERARRLRPGSPEIHEDIGLVYLDMGNYKQAIVMIEKALALDPDSESLIMSAAAVHEGAGNIDRAMALLDRAVTLNPQDPECCFELGRMLRANGDESQALEYLRRAARLGYEPAQEALGANGHGW